MQAAGTFSGSQQCCQLCLVKQLFDDITARTTTKSICWCLEEKCTQQADSTEKRSK